MKAQVPAWFCAAVAVFALPQLAPAQWSDNFDSYATGSGIAGQGNWELWCDPAGGPLDATVSADYANSAPNSLRIETASDVVQPFTFATSGQWVFSIQTYVPSTAFGVGYVNLMNTYCVIPFVNQYWSTATTFDADLGGVTPWGVGSLATLVYDQWVEYRVEVDLDADTFSEFYGTQTINLSVPWSSNVGAGGATEIAALDLYGDAAVGLSAMYFDDASLTQAGGGLCGDANCDGRFDGGDIDPFFVALGDPNLWIATYPNCDILESCDINHNGAANGGDIDPFFVALGLGYCP